MDYCLQIGNELMIVVTGNSVAHDHFSISPSNHQFILILDSLQDTLNVQNPISKEVTVCTGVSSWYQHKGVYITLLLSWNNYIMNAFFSMTINLVK